MSHILNQGDIVFMDFNPQAGHEQAGRRSALIVSNCSYNKYTNMVIVCPITNTNNTFPLHVQLVQLDDRTLTTGVILCEHVKALDLNARKAKFMETLPDDLLQEVLERIRLSIEQLFFLYQTLYGYHVISLVCNSKNLNESIIKNFKKCIKFRKWDFKN